jgi:hypothetical protein
MDECCRSARNRWSFHASSTGKVKKEPLKLAEWASGHGAIKPSGGSQAESKMAAAFVLPGSPIVIHD